MGNSAPGGHDFRTLETIKNQEDEDLIKQALVQGGAVAMAFDVFSDFETYRSGVCELISTATSIVVLKQVSLSAPAC